MRTATAATTGWWARLLLFAATLLGLAAMHTIGHGTHTGNHPAGHAVAPEHADRFGAVDALPAVFAGAVPVSVVAVDCPGGGCPDPAALPAGDPGGSPSGWSVCLAVLGALTMAVLLVLLLLPGRDRPGIGARRPAVRSPGPRAPPGRPVGLRLATVSVLRS
ncbi:hypothetical protein [Micromonospora sp. KC723]|uniref:hypothetical protein n=1 Tax=Micromonospora sp. KC723 TaxID=2530381 RepID=UPI001051B7BB|nr:hypothetical protein [Micromonospora sp. KC723]TDB73908.1 hypothetical protein E1165_15930 [Micromonospora sp. KC723]